MRRFRTPLALLLALLVGGVAYRLRSEPESKTQARAALVTRESIDIEKLSEVVIEREPRLDARGGADGARTRYRFERRGASWWQVEPVTHPADGWAVRQLAAKVLKTESVRSVRLADASGRPSPGTLASAGLSPPQGRITLRETAGTSAGRREVVIELGRRSLAGRAYARVVAPASPEPRYDVVDGSLHDLALERDPSEFRRRDLFVDLGEIDRVELSNGDVTTSIKRVGRAFRMDAPVKTRADRERCEELLDAIRRARSAGFVIDNPARLAVYGLEPPAAVIGVESGGTRTRLRIGDPVSIGAQDRFALVEGTATVVRLPAAVLAGIAPRADRLIDLVAAGVRSQDVGAIEIRRGEASIVLTRETDRWRAVVTEPELGELAGSADPAAVARLLGSLTEVRATAVQLGEFPSERAVAVVTLRGFAGDALDTVRIASSSQGGVILENGDGVLRLHGGIDMPLSRQEIGFTAAAKRP